jgi:hypothetical protein
VWTVHGLLYRWRATRLPKGAVEYFLGHAVEALHSAGGRHKTPERSVAFTPAALPELLSPLPRTPGRDS